MATTYDPFLLGLNQGQYHQALLQNAPGGPAIQQQLTGFLPADVLANIYQQGAERGVSTGMPGSPNANAATMRALGLTSLDVQQKGLENALALYGASPRLPGTPITTPAPPTLPHDTAYPMGGGVLPGPAFRGGPGTTPVEPAAPTGNYDQFLTDWLRRYNYGGAGGGGAPYTPATSTATAGAGAAGGGAVAPETQPIYSTPSGEFGDEGIDYSDPNWFEQFMAADFGGETPYGTTSFENASVYDPFGSALEYYGG